MFPERGELMTVREWGVAQEAGDILVSSGDPLSDPGSFELLVVEDDPAMVNVLAAGLGARRSSSTSGCPTSTGSSCAAGSGNVRPCRSSS
jgi:hypothetical protein